MQEMIIALDVGGSSVKSGIVDSQKDVHAIFSTPLDSKGSAETILSTFSGIVQHYLESYAVRGVGIGFPSPFDYENGICLIQGVDKYESIYGLDIGAEIHQRVQQPNLKIRFRNDAEAANIGEALYGAGRPYHRFIGVTLGTGMGSAFIADGKRIESGQGVPADGGFLFPVDYRGKQADEWFSTRGLLGRFADLGQPMPSVAEAAQAAEKNPLIRQAFAEFGADMADFIAPYAQAFKAEALIIMGGIAAAYPLFGASLENGLTIPVVRGALGEKAALLGAADLIR